MRWIKKNITTVLLLTVLLVGLFLLLYPTVSDYWNSFHQSRAIASYAESVAQIDDDTYEKMWNQAVRYNRRLPERANHWFMTKKQEEGYNRALNISGTGIMGYVEIPKIKVSLPIYHGTDEAILQVAVGHIPGSSLPVGGKGSHCVLSGHRGLPSAKLFTDLDQMEVGDTFMLRVLDETLTYEVDQILIVLPNEMSDLEFVAGEDLCTLVTCTPYGVNSHRLLVRGHRIANMETASDIRVTADAQQIEPVLVAPLIAGPILLILLVVLLTRKRPTI